MSKNAALLIIIYIMLSIEIFIISLWNSTITRKELIIAVISCNRYIYLNKTLYSLMKHIYNYEENLLYNILLIDQGTVQRYYIARIYNIYNSFFLNPNTYSFSFNILFSYLYSKYMLIMEEDWEVISEIEKHIFYPSFIGESIFILDNYKNVYGILLREIADILVNYSIIIQTKMGKHTLHVLQNMKNRYSYTNGACIYRCSVIAKIKLYKSEKYVSDYFKKHKYKLGFTYKGRKGKHNSTYHQCVMSHIGKKSTKSGLCNISLY